MSNPNTNTPCKNCRGIVHETNELCDNGPDIQSAESCANISAEQALAYGIKHNFTIAIEDLQVELDEANDQITLRPNPATTDQRVANELRNILKITPMGQAETEFYINRRLEGLKKEDQA